MRSIVPFANPKNSIVDSAGNPKYGKKTINTTRETKPIIIER